MKTNFNGALKQKNKIKNKELASQYCKINILKTITTPTRFLSHLHSSISFCFLSHSLSLSPPWYFFYGFILSFLKFLPLFQQKIYKSIFKTKNKSERDPLFLFQLISSSKISITLHNNQNFFISLHVGVWLGNIFFSPLSLFLQQFFTLNQICCSTQYVRVILQPVSLFFLKFCGNIL